MKSWQLIIAIAGGLTTLSGAGTLIWNLLAAPQITEIVRRELAPTADAVELQYFLLIDKYTDLEMDKALERLKNSKLMRGKQ